jgi:hypothetical protein
MQFGHMQALNRSVFELQLNIRLTRSNRGWAGRLLLCAAQHLPMDQDPRQSHEIVHAISLRKAAYHGCAPYIANSLHLSAHLIG